MVGIHPGAVTWKPTQAQNGLGRDTCYESEIGVVWKGVDGCWHAQPKGLPTLDADFKTRMAAQKAAEDVYHG